MVLVLYSCRLYISRLLLSETALKQENKVVTCVRVNYFHCLLPQQGIMSAFRLIFKSW